MRMYKALRKQLSLGSAENNLNLSDLLNWSIKNIRIIHLSKTDCTRYADCAVKIGAETQSS